MRKRVVRFGEERETSAALPFDVLQQQRSNEAVNKRRQRHRTKADLFGQMATRSQPTNSGPRHHSGPACFAWHLSTLFYLYARRIGPLMPTMYRLSTLQMDRAQL